MVIFHSYVKLPEGNSFHFGSHGFPWWPHGSYHELDELTPDAWAGLPRVPRRGQMELGDLTVYPTDSSPGLENHRKTIGKP